MLLGPSQRLEHCNMDTPAFHGAGRSTSSSHRSGADHFTHGTKAGDGPMVIFQPCLLEVSRTSFSASLTTGMLTPIPGMVMTRWDGMALGKEAAPFAALCG